MIDVSVLIPHYNQVDLLVKCLESVQSQQLSDMTFEIIVADNGTPSGLDEVITAFPSVIFLRVSERGAACARNAAMSIAQGRFYAFIDSDCEAGVGWLETGIAALEADVADLIGGNVVVTCENEDFPTPVETFEKIFGFRQQLYVYRKGFSVTANLFIRARDAKVNGTFTNGLSEDVDWCHRARALGFRLAFDGKALVRHPARDTWAALQLKWQRLILERWGGYTEGGRVSGLGKRIKWLVLSIVVGISGVAHIPFVLCARELSWGERLAATKVLLRIRGWRAWRMLHLLWSKPQPDAY